MTKVLTGALIACALALASPASASTTEKDLIERHLCDSGPPVGSVSHAIHVEPAALNGCAMLNTTENFDASVAPSFGSDAPEPTAATAPTWGEPTGRRLRGFERLVAYPPNVRARAAAAASNESYRRWRLPEVGRVEWYVSPGVATRA